LIKSHDRSQDGGCESTIFRISPESRQGWISPGGIELNAGLPRSKMTVREGRAGFATKKVVSAWNGMRVARMLDPDSALLPRRAAGGGGGGGAEHAPGTWPADLCMDVSRRQTG
jgi:hypothetical protein